MEQFLKHGRSSLLRHNDTVIYMVKKVSTNVLALASTNINPFSSANCLASSYVTSRWPSKSDLLPIKNITVLGLVKLRVSVNQLLK